MSCDMAALHLLSKLKEDVQNFRSSVLWKVTWCAFGSLQF